MKKILLYICCGLLSSVFFACQDKHVPKEETKVVVDGFTAIDLGLPSGILWADCNIGASTSAECGDYFAWGEVAPKSTYSWKTYIHCEGVAGRQTKYCTTKSYGIVDGKTLLESKDDAATVLWSTSWRMPTKAEMQELVDYCEWTWTDGGYSIVGPNEASIFLPAAGYVMDTTLGFVGRDAHYWTSTTNGESSADALYGHQNIEHKVTGSTKYCGQTIRPVCTPVR